MDVERRGNDYHVNLTTEEINVLCGYSNPNKTPLPLVAPVKKSVGEIFSLNCVRNRQLEDNSRVFDHVLFTRGEMGPDVVTDSHVLVSLLGTREFWVTRYDGDNKIWLRRSRV